MLFKKYKKKEVEEDLLHEKYLTRISNLNIEQRDKIIIYKEIKMIFIEYLKELIRTDKNLSENEIIHQISNINITSEIIEKTRKIINYIIHIEYNKLDYEKEALYKMISEIKFIIEQIYIQTKSDTLSKEEMLSGKDDKFIRTKLQKILDKIKNEYKQKWKINEDDIIKATEYYNRLKVHEKEEFSKEYHYLCRNLPQLIENIKNAKNSKNNSYDDYHQSISKINKILFKLEKEEKNEILPKILEVLDSNEEKININIMLAYSCLNSGKIKEAEGYYKTIYSIYSTFDKDKKNYYTGVINRFLNNMKKHSTKK